MRLCSRMILRFESREDDMLLALCAVCLDQEKYDETILTYLLTYYDGPVEKMKRLWDAGDTFGLDTYRLEEKILLMILFTRQGMDNTEKIFDSYRRSVGKKMLLKAYAILMSYEYFVRKSRWATRYSPIWNGALKGGKTRNRFAALLFCAATRRRRR